MDPNPILHDSIHHRPICRAPTTNSVRYPHYVCRDCWAKATDETGRPLAMNNIFSGDGLSVTYVDTDEEHSERVCVIEGIRCSMREARMGGIASN